MSCWLSSKSCWCLAWASGLGAGIQALAGRIAAAGCPVRMRLRGCAPGRGLVSLKGYGGRGCGSEHAALTAVRAAPMARKWEPLQPAAAAMDGPAGPRLARSVRMLTGPALASGHGVLYEAQGNAPSIKPGYRPR